MAELADATRLTEHSLQGSRVRPDLIVVRGFALTLLVEVPVVLAMLRRDEPNLARRAVLVVFVNLATHLVVWYVRDQLLDVGTIEYVVAAEAWAIGAEAVFYAAAVRGLPLYARWSSRRPQPRVLPGRSIARGVPA